MAINRDIKDLDFLKKELEIHKKNLGKLNLQKAEHGSINVPLSILNQIEDEENEIKRLEKEIEKPEEKEKIIKDDEKDAVSHEAEVSIKTGDISNSKVVIAGRDVHYHGTPPPEKKPHAFKNPFIKGRMITEPEDFFGRTNELKTIFTLLQSMSSCFVVGNRRIGRSSLLYYITLMCRERLSEDYKIVYVDLQSPQCYTLIGLITTIGEKLFPPSMLRQINSSNNILVEFEKNIKELRSAGVRPVICLDEFENLTKRTAEFTDDFFEAWRSLGQHGLLAFITASQSKLYKLCDERKLTSPFYNIFSLLELGVFSDKESMEFVDKDRPEIEFTPEEKEAIIQLAKGHPLKLQIAAWYITQAKLEGESDLQTAMEKARAEMDDMIKMG